MPNVIKALRARIQVVSEGVSVIEAKLRAAGEVRQSVELSAAAESINRLKLKCTGWLRVLEESDGNTSYIGQAARRLELELNKFKMPFVLGMAHDAKTVTHYCVTADKQHGYGVYSAHDNKEDARFNAILCGGKCAAVDRSEDGRIIEPAALKEARRLASEYC